MGVKVKGVGMEILMIIGVDVLYGIEYDVV